MAERMARHSRAAKLAALVQLLTKRPGTVAPHGVDPGLWAHARSLAHQQRYGKPTKTREGAMTDETAAQDRDLGQVAYERYRQHSGGYSLVTGALLPQWSGLSEPVRGAWNAAARAVVDGIDARNAPVTIERLARLASEAGFPTYSVQLGRQPGDTIEPSAENDSGAR